MRAATLWIKKIKEAKGAFKRIILKGDVPQEYLHQDHVHHEVLRRGRVHLDMAANVLFRYFFRTLDLDCIYFYLFVDASPQWRGRELYAASFDMMGIVATALFWQRRLFTQIAISRCMYSALGKTAALLWQILLQVGGEYWAMRAFCNNVAGVTTDLGTEKAIPDHPDILIPFCKSLGIHVPASARRQLHLFPIALASIGWFHLWDGILKFGLSLLVWFVPFLKVLKAVVRFLRDDVAEIKRAFNDAGLPGCVALIGTIKMPVFIEWRWGTIADVCRELVLVFSTLQNHFHLLRPVLEPMTDGAFTRKLRHAFQSIDWYREFSFVHWFADQLSHIMSWGASCPCHQREFFAQEPVECNYKGRVLPLAFDFACERLRELLDAANGWTETTWGGSRAFLVSLQAMVRAVFSRSHQKIAFLDRIPLLIGRLGEPGVRKRILDQYAEQPKENHNKVSIEVLEPGSEGRRDIEAMPDDTTLSDFLAHVRQRLRFLSFLDKVAEGPHAVFKKVHLHARGSTFQWQAATLRLKQHLKDFEDLCPLANVTLQWCWDRYKSVLQFGSRRFRNVRLSRSKFEQRVYFCNHVFDAEQSDVACIS